MKTPHRKKSTLACELFEMEIFKLIIAAVNQYFLALGFTILFTLLCSCYSSPNIRAICKHAINEAFRSHPSDREQAFSSFPVVIIFIDISGKSKITNLYHSGAAPVLLLRHKAVASSQVPEFYGNKRMESALQSDSGEKRSPEVKWFNLLYRTVSLIRLDQVASGLI